MEYTQRPRAASGSREQGEGGKGRAKRTMIKGEMKEREKSLKLEGMKVLRKGRDEGFEWNKRKR